MATYTHSAFAVPSLIPWYNVDLGSTAVGTPTSTLLVVLNSDGTETRFIGTGFSAVPAGGTITEIDRTSAGGGTVYETITGLNLSITALLNAPPGSNRSAFALIFQNADTFNGFAGDDFFVGGPGADSFIGAAGTNTVSYDNALAAVRADLGSPGTNFGDAAGDTYSNIQNLIGSDFNDQLIGNNANNVLTGGKGNDFLAGNGGNDTIDGGAGFDTAQYQFATASVTVTLSGNSSAVGDSSVGTDALISIEQIRGSGFGDIFTATTGFAGENGLFNEFEGLGGNDVITGNGVTRVAYGLATSGVAVDLLAGNAHSIAGGDAAGIGIDSFAGVIGPDNVNAVNGVRGSDFADTITAAGARGFFQFFGLGGNDTLTGSAEAINNFDYNLARYDYPTSPGQVNAGVVVTLGSTSTVTDQAGGNAHGTDTLINIERVRGTNLADSFTANAGFNGPVGNSNYFEGGGGNDTITGNGHTWAQYSNASAAVTVNLQTGVGQSTAGGDAAAVGVDTFTGGVNGLLGSLFDDTLIGSNGAQAEQFYGDKGNDNIDGGGGILDRVVYRGEPAGVTVNLLTHTATDGYGNTDTLTNIEGVVGTEFNDMITGDGNDNRIQGQNGDDHLFGGAGNDFLVGDDGVDLYANAFGTGGTVFDAGNDTLDGGTGADQMWGGKGNDTYFVDHLNDVVIENLNEGNDLINASVNYTLSTNVEALVLVEGAGALAGLGNGAGNYLQGNSDNNALDGGAGGDLMVGGAGDDIYVVDNIGDAITENVNGGNDIVHASIDYTIGANIESLILDGLTINGAGNATGNAIIGNDADNIIDGRGGGDLMQGGKGNDIYVIDNAADAIIENPNEGNDIVHTSIDYTIGENIESLILDGTTINGGGNGTDNAIIGNASDNIIDGKAGADLMQGGAGNDIYFVDNAGDSVIENPNEGNDIVHAMMDYTIGANIESLILDGTANLAGAGNSDGNAIVGNSGDNILDGRGGQDYLIGNAGNDTFAFKSGEAGGDLVADFAGNGAAVGDSFLFIGFGSVAQGATFTQVGATNAWEIHSGLDGHNEVITLQNNATVHSSDFFFV